jgi:hypothetical protein
MKRQVLYLWLLAGLAVFLGGCAIAGTESGLAEGEPAPSPSRGGWAAVYFAPNEEDTVLNGEPIPEDIFIVRTTEQLQEAFDQSPAPRMLYLQSGALDEVDSAWLKERYREEVMIIAINAPISELGTKLDYYPEMEDIDMVNIPPGFTVFSALQYLSGSENTSSHRWVLSDYFASFASAASALAASDEYNRMD